MTESDPSIVQAETAQAHGQPRAAATAKKVAALLLLAILGAAMTVLLSSVVSYNMDEFLPYHPIACSLYPFNVLNAFRTSCQAYDLNFLGLGWITHFRANNYVGAAPSLWYLPFFLLWKSPLSTRFAGYVFLMIQAFLLSRISGRKSWYVLIGLLIFFPYSYQHFIDLGPLGFQITSVYLCYTLADRWSTTLQSRYISALAIVIFFDFWTKLSFFWMVPGIAVIGLFHVFQQRAFLFQAKNMRRIAAQGVLSLLIVLLPLLSLLFSTAPGNPTARPYIRELLSHSSIPISEFASGAWYRSGVIEHWLKPFTTTERSFNVLTAHAADIFYNFLLYVSIPLIILFLISCVSALRKRLIPPLMFYGVFLFTLLFIAKTRDAWGMHHTVLAFPFFILCVALSASALWEYSVIHSVRWPKIVMAAWSALFILMNAFYLAAFPVQSGSSDQNFSTITLNSILNDERLSQEYFFVDTSGELYFLQSLYGRSEQGVLNIIVRDSSQIETLRELALKNRRKLLFVFDAKRQISDMDLIRESFPAVRCAALSEQSSLQILMEEDETKQSICDTAPANSLDENIFFPRSLVSFFPAVKNPALLGNYLSNNASP